MKIELSPEDVTALVCILDLFANSPSKLEGAKDVARKLSPLLPHGRPIVITAGEAEEEPGRACDTCMKRFTGPAYPYCNHTCAQRRKLSSHLRHATCCSMECFTALKEGKP